MTNVVSTPVCVVEATFVASPRLAPDSYPAAVDVRPLRGGRGISVGHQAAAVLFAVNVTAVLPLTPSNLGVFQAACVAVLELDGD